MNDRESRTARTVPRLLRRHLEAAGFTLLELVIVVAVVGILAAAVLPLARWSVKRQNEYELQEELRVLRDAIDRYHDMAVAGVIESDASTRGWPPDLETLVEGVELTGQAPPVMPAVSDGYTATGPGLVGGFTGEDRSGSAAGTGSRQGGRRSGPATFVSRSDESGDGGILTFSRDGRSIRVQGNVSLQLDGRGALSVGDESLLDRLDGGASPGGSLFADRADRERALGPDGRPVRIVFLRRIPVDPMTGEADWGFRCYGEEPGDDLWCGRNVFDVYSKSRATGIDGRPYREW